jgi:hypothetical protein
MTYSLLKLLKAQKMAQDGVISASKSFKKATWLQLVEYCNGCGASGSWFRPPAYIWGVWIGPACISHDWDYTFGTTEFGKLKADWRMYKNIIKLLIDGELLSKWKPLYFMKNRAWVYYRSVRRFGKTAYWKNKIDSTLNKN